MVDLCRPSTLSTNNSLGSNNSTNDPNNNGSSKFFPSLFVCIDIVMKKITIFKIISASLFATD